MEIAIFTKEIADELIVRGFTLVGRSKLAWFFEDSTLLQETVEELIKLQ